MPKRNWTAKQLREIPELRHFAFDHKLARRAARCHRFGKYSPNLLCIAFVLGWLLTYIIAISSLIVLWALVESTGDTSPPGWVLLILLIAGPFGCMVALAKSLQVPFHDWLSRKHLRTELRRRGIPICIPCGYEGGDIDAPRCPECGAPPA